MTLSERSISNSEGRSQTLALIADTLFSSTVFERSEQEPVGPTEAGPLDLVPTYRALIQTSQHVAPDLQWDRLLDGLENAQSNHSNFGIAQPFSSMSLQQRTVTLQKWRDHHSQLLRLAFQALKRSGLYAAYSHLDDTGTNPNWRSLDYQPLTNPPLASDPNEIQIADLSSIERTYDFVIVGSGAGGSVAAYELTRVGYRVLVLEQGMAYTTRELGQSEWFGNRKLMAKSLGPLTPEGMPILLSGQGLGGGTTVNWMSCLPPSPPLLASWGNENRLDFVSRGELADHCNAVMAALEARTQPHLMNRQNQLLKSGCDILGWESKDIPRNTVDCEACDLCQFGCNAGHKRDARTTFLRDAGLAGATLLPRTRAVKIEQRGPQNTNLTCVHRTKAGDKLEIKIRTHKVILAAGSLETPALLHRSGIRNPHLGHHLHLHPAAIIFGRYETPVHPWKGPPQSVVCEEFAADLLNDGFRLETVPLHPGLAAMALPWETDKQHKTMMKQLSHVAGWLVLLQDLDGGHISLDSARPQPHYQLSERDEIRLKRGMTRALECHRAAGAVEVFSSGHRFNSLDLNETSGKVPIHSEIASLDSSQLGLYSAHQMSTCRMAATCDLGVTNTEGQVFGTDHLYIADASLCPTATGVNPMVTVMGLARHVSQQLSER